jgi:hypothetical protein
MSLAGGSVSVNQTTELATGNGLAKALYDADVATLSLPSLPVVGQTSAPFAAGRPCTQADVDVVKAARLALLNDAARRANAYGTATVAYFTTNAAVTVNIPTSASGLQRTPNPNNANTDTQGPSTSKTLSGTVS